MPANQTVSGTWLLCLLPSFQNLATIIKAGNESGISKLPFANEVAVPFSANWLITQGGKVRSLL